MRFLLAVMLITLSLMAARANADDYFVVFEESSIDLLVPEQQQQAKVEHQFEILIRDLAPFHAKLKSGSKEITIRGTFERIDDEFVHLDLYYKRTVTSHAGTLDEVRSTMGVFPRVKLKVGDKTLAFSAEMKRPHQKNNGETVDAHTREQLHVLIRTADPAELP